MIVKSPHPWQRGYRLETAVAIFALCLLPASAVAFDGTDRAKLIRTQAEQFENLRDWGAAADKYEELLRLDRGQSNARERYNYCLRRYFQVLRFRDTSYQREVLSLKYAQAIRLYELVVRSLME